VSQHAERRGGELIAQLLPRAKPGVQEVQGRKMARKVRETWRRGPPLGPAETGGGTGILAPRRTTRRRSSSRGEATKAAHFRVRSGALSPAETACIDRRTEA